MHSVQCLPPKLCNTMSLLTWKGFVLFSCCWAGLVFGNSIPDRDKGGFKFLLAVNDTWSEKGCFSIVETPLMMSNSSEHVAVGACDSGPLTFQANKNEVLTAWNHWSKITISLEFRSSVIMDASPPTCVIHTNGTFILPPQPRAPGVPGPLPGCFTADSREGYHMTYFWFYLYQWPQDL